MFAVVFAVVVASLFALLLFAPGIQRRVFLSSVEALGRVVQVDHLSVRPGGAEIRGLSWNEPGRSLFVREMRVTFRLMDALSAGPVLVEDLVVRGLQAECGTDGVATDRAEVIHLPAGVAIARCRIDGEVVLLGGPWKGSRVVVEVDGTDLGSEDVGRLSWHGRVADAAGVAAIDGGAPVSGVREIRIAEAAGADQIVASLGALLQSLAQEALEPGHAPARLPPVSRP